MPNIEIPDIIKSASDAAQDNLPATMQQTDGVLSTVVGFFNNVMLYPVQKANWTFKYKLENFKADLENKINNIPAENLQKPPLMISGPTLDALRYAYDEKELREMYENLLASSMDNRNNEFIQPSFVDAIRQMSPLDALILKRLADLSRVMAAQVTFDIKNTNAVYTNAMPYLFVPELIHDDNPFAISTSVLNLSRLGFIVIMDGEIKERDYDSILQHPYVKERTILFNKFGREIKINKINKAIFLNDYGKAFVNVCLENIE